LRKDVGAIHTGNIDRNYQLKAQRTECYRLRLEITASEEQRVKKRQALVTDRIASVYTETKQHPLAGGVEWKDEERPRKRPSSRGPKIAAGNSDRITVITRDTRRQLLINMEELSSLCVAEIHRSSEDPPWQLRWMLGDHDLSPGGWEVDEGVNVSVSINIMQIRNVV
jgi:hypothetical protein